MHVENCYVLLMLSHHWKGWNIEMWHLIFFTCDSLVNSQYICCFFWTQFPSMSSLHGALPNVSPSLPMHPPSQSSSLHAWNPPLPNVGTVQSSTLGYPPHAWTPPLPSFQGSLPNVPPSGITHPSNLGNPSHAWTPTPSSSYAAVPPGMFILLLFVS